MVKKHEASSIRNNASIPLSLETEAIKCRLLARKFALERGSISDELNMSLSNLLYEINTASDKEMKQAALKFHKTILDQIGNTNKQNRRSIVLHACDILR